MASSVLSNVEDSTSPRAPNDQCSPSRLDDEPVEVAFAPVGADRLVLVEVELFVLVIDFKTEGDLPVRRDAIGAGARAELARAIRLLALYGGRALQAEHPVPPAIARDRRPLCL